MKKYVFPLFFVLVFACVVQAQDVQLSCSNGQCSLQRSAPVATVVSNTAEAAVRVAAAPVRWVATNQPVRRLVVRPVRSFVRRLGCCR